MKLIVSYCFILAFILKINAQVNLVPNPSFETYSTCPSDSNQVIALAIPWQGVTTNSTDYFNACSSTWGVPSTPGGWQYARTGSAYGGVFVINSFGGDYREYLQVKLDSSLKQDSCYLVEFYCNSANAMRYYVNKMGAYLSNTAVNDVGPGTWGLVLQHTPQIISHNFLNDTLNWMRVSGYYKANGGEQYITIGNFNTDSTTDTLHLGGSNYDGAYYFIDDVTVKKIAGCDTTLSVSDYANNLRFKLYPNPNNGNMMLDYALNSTDKGKILIYDIAGKLIYKYDLDASANQIIISHAGFNNGIYFYRISVNGKIIKTDKILIVK